LFIVRIVFGEKEKPYLEISPFSILAATVISENEGTTIEQGCSTV
jgi:hypothetical protein